MKLFFLFSFPSAHVCRLALGMTVDYYEFGRAEH